MRGAAGSKKTRNNYELCGSGHTVNGSTGHAQPDDAGHLSGQFCLNTITWFFLTWFPTYLVQAKGMSILIRQHHFSQLCVY